MCDDTKISNLIHNFDEERDLKSDFYLFLIYGFPWEKQGFYWKHNKIYGFLYLAKVKILVSIRANSKSKLIFYYLYFFSIKKMKSEIRFYFLSEFGRLGIRTLDTVARIHVLQTCAFDHSANLPATRVLSKNQKKSSDFLRKSLFFIFI